MLREWSLLIVSVTITLILVLSILRWFAPQLLGISVDLQMVQVSDEVLPFFDSVFRPEDHAPDAPFKLRDPFIKRYRPFYREGPNRGPGDLLGFRNRFVPNRADIVVIGDSHTYGHNTSFESNWPSQLRDQLSERPIIYNMSVGGWGGVEYFEIFDKALYFKPHTIIVAFYTGNDPRDSYRMAYAEQRWSVLRPDSGLHRKDLERVNYPAPLNEQWPVTFADGMSTIFTPQLRLASNRPTPAVHAGWDIMALAARKMVTQDRANEVKIIFTIIPSKELVYVLRIRQEGLAEPEEYTTLIEAEQRNIARLQAQLSELSSAQQADVVGPLQQAALGDTPLYPATKDGHPSKAGYAIIARVLAEAVSSP